MRICERVENWKGSPDWLSRTMTSIYIQLTRKKRAAWLSHLWRFYISWRLAKKTSIFISFLTLKLSFLFFHSQCLIFRMNSLVASGHAVACSRSLLVRESTAILSLSNIKGKLLNPSLKNGRLLWWWSQRCISSIWNRMKRNLCCLPSELLY